MAQQARCYYCDRDEGFRSLLFEVCDLRASKVFLCKDQTLPGRCTIMFHDHVEELYQIPKEERDLFMDDVCLLAQTIKELFGADKINYAIYGDEVKHVHFTLCPKYRGKLGFGKPFILFPEKEDLVYLTQDEYEQRISLLRSTLTQRMAARPAGKE